MCTINQQLEQELQYETLFLDEAIPTPHGQFHLCGKMFIVILRLEPEEAEPVRCNTVSIRLGIESPG